MVYNIHISDNILLTKSDFLLFLEAPRHLWSDKHGLIDVTPSQFEVNIMTQGYEVESLAKEYLEKYVLKPDEDLIFQETFNDKQYTVRTDILIYKPAANSYDLYEVKSGTSIKKENIYDVTYQFLIVNKHIKVDRVFILHLNSEYIRYSNLNVGELFIAEDVSKKVLEHRDEVDKLRDIALETAHKPSHEDTQPCLNPKCCPCPGICHPGIPEYSIFARKEKAKHEKRKKEQHTSPKQRYMSRNYVSFLTPGSRNNSKEYAGLCIWPAITT